MRGWFHTAAAVLLCLIAPALPAAAESGATEVEVVRNGESWTATFTFPKAAAAWIFLRSPLSEKERRPWRPQSWRVLTEGVRLERRGHADLLVGTNGPVPRQVKIAFTPFGGRVVADYDPAIVLTDGRVALYSEQFDALPLAEPAKAETLPRNLGEADLIDHPSVVRFRDQAGPVVHHGRATPVATVADDRGGYVLFGGARSTETNPAESGPAALVIDPQLPAWLGTALGDLTPRMLDLYGRWLGPLGTERPMLIVGWAGATEHVSFGGGTLPNLIVMRFEGARLMEPNPEAAQTNLWFVAHESAHFWFAETVRYETPRDAWITEGAADLLAARAMAEVDPGFDPKVRLQTAVDQCLGFTRGRGVASAADRDEHQASYACGAVFGLVAEAATKKPFGAFARELLDANRADGILTRAEWLAAVDRASGDPMVSRTIGRLIDQGVEDPKATFAGLFRRAGVAFAESGDGRLVLK